ncbi:BA14K family protein [Rhizobiaceae bacterium LC148]|jgi:hypothetical protein|nr:BA14K family protein [Rhizobiaceae bacterium LC148]
MRKLSIVALAIVTALSGIAPAHGFSTGVPAQTVTTQKNVHLVQDRGPSIPELRRVLRDREDRRDRREWRRDDRREWRRDDRREWRRDWRGDRRDRYGWYNGHRGYRDWRRGYRRHRDGWWYPLAAFGAGAVIGGAIASQPRVVTGLPARHVDWCSARYRTYRVSDNTYVPRAGVRAECRSPYY